MKILTVSTGKHTYIEESCEEKEVFSAAQEHVRSLFWRRISRRIMRKIGGDQEDQKEDQKGDQEENQEDQEKDETNRTKLVFASHAERACS